MSLDGSSSGQPTLEASFREAWRSLPDESTFAGRLARQSLEASARQDPALEKVLFEVQNHAQSELDLHLDGDAVSEHATSALQFADLIRGIAEAVKEVSKSAMGRKRLPTTLQVLAPMPGSVRVVLRAEPPAERDGVVRGTDSSTQDSSSLATVANILARAGATDDGDVLSGLTTGLAIGAHPGLRRAAKAVAKAGWRMEGTLRRPQTDPIKLRVDAAGATRLLQALDARTEKTESLELTGQIDGQRRSVGAMWFVPVGSASFEAAVPDADLLDRVASLAATAQPVRARFQVVTRAPAGATSGARRTFALKAVEVADSGSLIRNNEQ